MCLASQLLVRLPSGHALFHVFGVFFPGGYYFLAFITHTCTFYLRGPETGLKGVSQTLGIRKCPGSDLALAVLFPSRHSGESGSPAVPQGLTHPEPQGSGR